MSVWLKVSSIVFAAVLISIGISLIPAASGLPSLPRTVPPGLREQPLLDALFVRPPQAAVGACLGSIQHTALTHDDYVRLARCLHRKHLVGANTVAAVERNEILGATHIGTLHEQTTRATWWWLLTWALALVAIAVVVYRRPRHRPPPPGAAATRSSG